MDDPRPPRRFPPRHAKELFAIATIALAAMVFAFAREEVFFAVLFAAAAAIAGSEALRRIVRS
jgi:uncharacterized membrane protein